MSTVHVLAKTNSCGMGNVSTSCRADGAPEVWTSLRLSRSLPALESMDITIVVTSNPHRPVQGPEDGLNFDGIHGLFSTLGS